MSFDVYPLAQREADRIEQVLIKKRGVEGSFTVHGGRFKVGPEYEFDLKVILDRREVPPCVLGSGSRLGMTSWLKAPGRPHAEDVFVIVGERQALPASSV